MMAATNITLSGEHGFAPGSGLHQDRSRRATDRESGEGLTMTNAAHIPSAPTVLAIGAHPDDIELGCGATLLRHRAQGHHVALLVMTSGTHGPRLERSRVEEQQDAADLLGAEVYWGGFQDGAIPEGRAAIEVIERVMKATGATVMYTHSPNDSHQDHRATAAASAAAGRRVKTI